MFNLDRVYIASTTPPATTPLSIIYAGDKMDENTGNNTVPLFVPTGSKAAYSMTLPYSRFQIIEIDYSENEEIKMRHAISHRRYNLFGQPVDENYRGIVIENGIKKVSF